MQATNSSKVEVPLREETANSKTGPEKTQNPTTGSECGPKSKTGCDSEECSGPSSKKCTGPGSEQDAFQNQIQNGIFLKQNNTKSRLCLTNSITGSMPGKLRTSGSLSES